MFEILRKSVATGIVTTGYPEAPAAISSNARGRPEIDFARWKDARPAAAVCPTGAITCADCDGTRTATLDLGACILCGLCAEVDTAIRMTNRCELAARHRGDLRTTAKYRLRPDGTHESYLTKSSEQDEQGPSPSPPIPRTLSGLEERAGERRPFKSSTAQGGQSIETTGRQLQERINKVLGRSLHIREVDAGSCNGCEIEIVGLNSPVYDIERFGIHFVASPRHADMLLVTGPVSRNMEVALRKTYDAMPAPRLVVAVGACGCSGGIFGQNYASLGGVDRVVPVDIYIPGCPPNPHALLHGILLAISRNP